MCKTHEELQAENTQLQQHITELQVRLATQKQEAAQYQMLLHDIIDNAPTALFVKDTQGRFILANKHFASLLMAEPESLIGKTAYDLLPEAIANDIWTSELQVLTSGEPLEHEEHIPQGDEMRTLLSIKFPIADETGKHYALGGILTDCTEQKQTEANLQRYVAIIESATDPIAAANPQQHPLLMNQAFRRMTGMDILHKDAATVKRGNIRPEWVIKLLKEEGYPTAIREGFWSGETALNNLVTGEEIPVSQVLVTHRRADGTIDFFSTIIRDLRPLKQAEAERTALQEQIIAAQHAALRELSSPLIPITSNIVLMPLIGSIDSNRAQNVMETLLEGVASHQATVAILDITGISAVDTRIAHTLVQATQAVRLLGAQVVLTGISPTMAQTLVHLEADLSSIVTRSNLQRAITYAWQEQTGTTINRVV
jgi:PAS domain S-box-containing protein